MFSFLLLLASGAPELANAAFLPQIGDKIVCRREPQTGSRFRKKVCLLRNDVEARAEHDQVAMRGMVDADQPNPVGKN
ncbi:MAG: hypothetical protein ACREDU_08005 [Methylocella sp.]